MSAGGGENESKSSATSSSKSSDTVPPFTEIQITEVNRNNFSKIWPYLLVCIKSADFTAMDLELSGLGGPGLRSKDVQERYKSIREAAHTRSILSVGITTMKLIRKSEKRRSLRYETRIFNILTLSEKPFTIEPSALQFLAKHSFDFNRLIQSGVQFQGKNCPLKTLSHEFLGSSATLCLHNGFVDLAFLYKQMYDVDLPETLDEFVNNLSDLFPDDYLPIADSKYLEEYQTRYKSSYLDLFLEEPGRVDTWQITFYWLPILNEEVIQKVVGDDEWNLRHVTQLYENEEKWRIVSVETVFKPEVDEIFSQMNSILQARDSSIYEAFSHSSFVSLSPAASADLALMESVEGGTILSPTDTPSQPKNSSNGGKIRKMSKIFMSSVMGRKPSQSESKMNDQICSIVIRLLVTVWLYAYETSNFESPTIFGFPIWQIVAVLISLPIGYLVSQGVINALWVYEDEMKRQQQKEKLDMRIRETLRQRVHECPICWRERAKFPVMTECGHIFCCTCFVESWRHITREERPLGCPSCTIHVHKLLPIRWPSSGISDE